MEIDPKIDKSTPDLLVKYRHVVKAAAEKGIREALARHKANGNPVAISRNGEVVILQPDDIVSVTSSLDVVWNNEKDDVYVELMP